MLIRRAEPFEGLVEKPMYPPDTRIDGRSLLVMGLGIDVRLVFQEIFHHRGNQGSCEEIRGQHGEHDSHGQRGEEIVCNAGQKEDWHEDDADAERGHEGRSGDLLGPIEDRADRPGAAAFES